MNAFSSPTALIAEDEHLLAAALQGELAQAWPELRVIAVVGDGGSAVTQALKFQPDVLFFDIRMPGMSGMEAAAELADAWDTSVSSSKPFPVLVFVTAYDQYAVKAFETQAIDYLLKPIQPDRLKKTVEKVRLTLSARAQGAITKEAYAETNGPPLEATLTQLRQLMGVVTGAIGAPVAEVAPLKFIQASVGNSIRMVPTQDVVYFEAADKYVRVLTTEREYLIRTSLKELLPQLDCNLFWQIHRGTVVNCSHIDNVTRDEVGKLWLQLRGRSERLSVSRLYAYLFRAM